MSDVGLRQLHVLEEAGADPARVVVGHADSYPVLDYWLAIMERGASIEFDFLGMSFTPQERKAEPRLIPLLLSCSRAAGRPRLPVAGRLSQRAAALLRGKRLHVPPGDVLPRLRAPEWGGRDPPDDRGDPRRLLTIG